MTYYARSYARSQSPRHFALFLLAPRLSDSRRRPALYKTTSKVLLPLPAPYYLLLPPARPRQQNRG
jgi:hypothetical protein